MVSLTGCARIIAFPPPSSRTSSNRPGIGAVAAPLARREPLVVEPEQLQRPLHVLLTPYRITHPPSLRQDVMQLRPARRHQLLAHPHREWKIHPPSPVQVPDLVPVHPKLDPVEPVRSLLYPRPTRHLPLDSLSDTRHRSEEHTSELQSRQYLVCRLLLE